MHIMCRVLLALVLSTVALAAHAETKREHLSKMTREMLAPVVSVLRDGKAGASAVIVYSKEETCTAGVLSPCGDPAAKSEVHTYALTALHVAEKFLFEPLMEGMPKASRVRLPQPRPMRVAIWSYGAGVGSGTKQLFDARIVAESGSDDLALIRIDAHAGVLRDIARLAPAGSEPLLNDTAWAVGGAGGFKPGMKAGLFEQAHEPGSHPEVANYLYLTSTPIFFGDSGGGLYQRSEERNRYELVGVMSSMFRTANLAFSVSLPRIYAFLGESGFDFIREAHKPAR